MFLPLILGFFSQRVLRQSLEYIQFLRKHVALVCVQLSVECTWGHGGEEGWGNVSWNLREWYGQRFLQGLNDGILKNETNGCGREETCSLDLLSLHTAYGINSVFCTAMAEFGISLLATPYRRIPSFGPHENLCPYHSQKFQLTFPLFFPPHYVLICILSMVSHQISQLVTVLWWHMLVLPPVPHQNTSIKQPVPGRLLWTTCYIPHLQYISKYIIYQDVYIYIHKIYIYIHTRCVYLYISRCSEGILYFVLFYLFKQLCKVWHPSSVQTAILVWLLP